VSNPKKQRKREKIATPYGLHKKEKNLSNTLRKYE